MAAMKLIECCMDRFLAMTAEWPEFRVCHFVSQCDWDDAREAIVGIHGETLMNVEAPDECIMLVRIGTTLGDAICCVHYEEAEMGGGGDWGIKTAGSSAETAEAAMDALCVLLPMYEATEDESGEDDDEPDEMMSDADNVPQGTGGEPPMEAPAQIPPMPPQYAEG